MKKENTPETQEIPAFPYERDLADLLAGKKEWTLTTGQVAGLLSVAPRTVVQWCDGGKMQCFQLPPAVGVSRDRRILFRDFVTFCDEYAIPRPMVRIRDLMRRTDPRRWGGVA